MIPQELRDLDQWVVWNDKLPLQLNGSAASTINPSTWTTFEYAARAVKLRRFAGYGFVFTPDDPYVGIDLDHVVDSPSHANERAMAIVRAFNSYTEDSPSGTGMHIICRATKPGERCKKTNAFGPGTALEIYSERRYFRITGSVVTTIPRNPADGIRTVSRLRNCQEQLEALYAWAWPEDADSEQNPQSSERGSRTSRLSQSSAAHSAVDASQINEIVKAIKLGTNVPSDLRRLFVEGGTYSQPKTPSDLDWMLIKDLLRMTRDPALTHALFLKSALGRRLPRSHGANYVETTIENALRSLERE